MTLLSEEAYVVLASLDELDPATLEVLVADVEYQLEIGARRLVRELLREWQEASPPLVLRTTGPEGTCWGLTEAGELALAQSSRLRVSQLPEAAVVEPPPPCTVS